MIRVSRPIRNIHFRLVSPRNPSVPIASREQFKMWTRATGFHELILLVRLARVLTLSCRKKVYLPASWIQCSRVLSSDTKKEQFCNVPEVEADSAPIGSAVFPDFMPNDIALVLKPPRLHDVQALRQEGIRHPKVQVGDWGRCMHNGQGFDLAQGESTVPREPSMLRGDLSRSVLKLPRRVRQNSPEPPCTHKRAKVFRNVGWMSRFDQHLRIIFATRPSGLFLVCGKHNRFPFWYAPRLRSPHLARRRVHHRLAGLAAEGLFKLR